MLYGGYPGWDGGQYSSYLWSQHWPAHLPGRRGVHLQPGQDLLLPKWNKSEEMEHLGEKEESGTLSLVQIVDIICSLCFNHTMLAYGLCHWGNFVPFGVLLWHGN